VSLTTLRLAALGALIPLFVAYADAPWRTFGQRYVAHRWSERMVLFSIELNLLVLWTLAKLLVGRDAAIAPDSLRTVFAGAGVVLAWAAVAFAIWAKLTLGRWFSVSFAIKPHHELVTLGPYAIVRHPMYTALVALGLGLALAWDSWVSVGFALLYAVPFWMHTVIEEQMFAAHFTDVWSDYKARVPRLVPGWKPRLTATPSPRP
jgi:protein-S-isoprenylcysteine O-methyltransferase Ste14